MSSVSGAGGNGQGIFGYASVNFRRNSVLQSTASTKQSTQHTVPSSRTLLQLHQLQEAIAAIKPRRISATNSGIAAQAAMTISETRLDLTSNTNTRLQSVAEINMAPTSFQQNGPPWLGSTVTAPWSGLGSTADATVGGTYDGSNGEGTLTFKVRKDGTHGEDDLKIQVLAPNGSKIEDISIDKNDPLNQVYELSNGLTVSLSAGDLVKNDTFQVDTSLVSTSFTPTAPLWTGSTAAPTIGGLYDGSNGTGDLTFEVNREGIHGEDDLKIRIYDTSDAAIETITIRKKDAINKVYDLSNGLTLSLDDGALIKHETFKLAVDAADPSSYTSAPAWQFGSSTATVGGTYDGSSGTGTLTFESRKNGVHGEDDLQVRVYDTDGSTLETISIDADDPVNQTYELSNGLTVNFSAGDMIKNERFTVDVQAETSFSTVANPVESTAVAAIGGIYDGSLGTDTLTFMVTAAGTHGSDDLALDAYKSDGSFLESINIAGSDPVNQTYSLSSGLEFSLAAGTLALNETFTLDVNHLVPTTVNPNLSFDAIGINDAKLESGFVIVDGSFQINGTAIEVFANDSINSVLDRINTANIDISAMFDAATDSISLTRDTPGAQYDIVLANDTSGFLAATKLSTAVAQGGNGDENAPLQSLAIMASVTSGSLNVNGVSIALDVHNDSISDVLARIEQSVANVSANFDADTGLVSILSTNSDDLTISSGGTGFFAALQIDDGIYDYVAEKNGSSRQGGYSSNGRRLTLDAMSDFAKRLNTIFDDESGRPADAYLDKIRRDLKVAIGEAFAADPRRQDSDNGIQFDFSRPAHGVLDFSDRIQSQFANSLKSSSGAKDFHSLFFGMSSRDEGLLDRLSEIAQNAEKSLIRAGGIGLFVDTVA